MSGSKKTKHPKRKKKEEVKKPLSNSEPDVHTLNKNVVKKPFNTNPEDMREDQLLTAAIGKALGGNFRITPATEGELQTTHTLPTPSLPDKKNTTSSMTVEKMTVAEVMQEYEDLNPFEHAFPPRWNPMPIFRAFCEEQRAMKDELMSQGPGTSSDTTGLLQERPGTSSDTTELLQENPVKIAEERLLESLDKKCRKHKKN